MKTSSVAPYNKLPKPIMENYDWQLRGLCRDEDPEVFFLPDNARMGEKTKRVNLAKKVCEGCPVIQECLSYALKSQQDYGVWGGMSQDERRRLLGRKVVWL